NFNTEDGSLRSSACSVNLGSTTTASGLAFEAFNLQGEIGREFGGYVKVVNPNGNPLDWSLVPKENTASAFEGVLILVDTNNPNQKKIYAKKVKAEGSFPIELSITDKRTGAVATTTAKIIIGRDKPRVEAESVDFILNKNKLSYSFYIYDNSVASGSLPSSTLKLNGANQPLSLPTILKTASNINNDLKLKIEQLERGKFKLTIFQEASTITGLSASADTILKYTVSLKNSSGTVVANKDFTITLKQDKPIFDYQCEENVRKYDNYSCLIKVSNADNHDISYTVSGLTGTTPPTNLKTTPGKNTITIHDKVIVENLPQPPVISDFGTCTVNDKGTILQSDKLNYSKVTERLWNNYNSVLGKGINFIKFPTTPSENTNNRTSTTTPTSTSPTENKTYEKNTLPSSSFLTPIIKTLAFIKASFVTGEALADKYVGDTGGTCQTSDEVYADYLRAVRDLDETISAPTPQIVFPITITAKNEYGASAVSTFSLKVNTYCGDGVKQAPNQEKRGGLYNDGVEECDGVAGVAVNAADSSVMKQYACTTPTNHGAIPNPITTNDFCRATGGFCGDGICGEDDDTYLTDDTFEKYDPGNNTDQYCHADCAYCGDGIVQSNKGEVCDPGDPYSVQVSLGEVCNKKCKIVRNLKILQVYPSSTREIINKTISAKGVLNALGKNEDYSFFRDSIAIENISTTPGAIDYKVDNATIDEFNSEISSYLPVGDLLQNYSLIVFGFGDIASDDLSTSTKLIVESFIKNGGMVIFGSGSITNASSKSDSRNFNYFGGYAGISSGYSSNAINSVKKNNSEAFSASQLFELPSQFTISSSSPKYKLASNGSSCGAQCAGIACTASSSRLIDWFDYNISNQRSDNTNPISWASSCNRVGLLQIYSKNATINLEEFKVFGNLIYHLSTLVSGDNF
ncbi:MAG: hypothetical protein PHR57_03965, partial [Patescibacteria group bacterium]|nr:hypothetical protein [Patescibacteria group bacterium]